MASNVFAPRSPADIYQESLGVRQKAVDPKQKLEAASARHGVPVNVLLAVAEADGDTDLANIEATAHDLGAAIAGGSDLKKALEVKTGDPDRARAIGQRANQLLDILQPQAAPAPKADNGSVVGDLARQFGGTAVSGIGGAVDALGIAAEQGVGRTEKGEFRRFGERVGESIRGAGEALTDSVSDAGKAALQGSTPDGDISDPSSWTLGDDPSARGYAMQLAGVLGSMAPVVAASVLTRNPAVAAAAGGAQGGGAGADEARQSVLDMAEQMDADGAPMLGKAPAYQKAIAEGLDHTAAVQRTADEAARQAFNWTAPVSGLGGAATQRIIAPVERRVSGSIAGAIAGRAALSGAEEATQEVAEGVATRHGTNEATGLDGDLFEGSFGNAILGALGGGAVGAASGAMDRRERDAAPAPAPTQVPPAEPGLTQIEAQARPLALPAPVPPTAEDTPDVVVTPPPAPRPAGPLGIRQNPRPLMIEGPRDPASAEAAPDVIVTPPPTGPRPAAPLGIRAQEPPLMIGGPREPASAEAAPGVIVPPAPEAKVHPGFEKPYVGSGSAPMGPVAPGPVSQQAVGAAPIPAPSMGDPLGILPAPALAPEPAPIPAPPVGTLSAAVSQLAPAPIAAPAPEPRFPDQKAGSSIRLAGMDGAVGDGVFIRETPEGQAVVRVDGEEYTLSPFDFDRARGEATRIDEEAKAAKKGQATAKASELEPAFAISDQQVGGKSETVAEDNANFAAEMPDNGQDYQSALNRVAAPAPAPETVARQQPTIEAIRAKAAILRGVPENATPDVPGISLKWDAKEGGFIFSRKHVDKVQAAIGGAPANPEVLTVGQDPAPAPQQFDAVAPVADATPAPAKLRRPIGKNANGRALFEDERGVRSYEPDREDGALHPRYTESVAVKPGGGISIDTSRRGKDYLTPEEWTALEQSAGPRLKTKDEGRAAGEAWARAGKAEQDRDPAMGNASDAAKGAWTAGYRRARKAMDADGTTDSTAPEHAAVGVDNRELSEIVAEFHDAEKSMRDGGDKIHHLFDAPAKDEIVRLGKKAGVRQSTQDGKRVYHRDEGWMTPAEAKAKIAEWKAHARAQKKTGQNADKVVLSLFDLTGSWSKPWEEAGYQVFRFDIQADPEVGDVNNFSTEFFGDWFGDFDGMDIHAILAACPCTDFASSGSRHFAAKDEDGRTVASVKLVHQTLATIEHFRPALWAIENPVGRIENLGGLPPWRMSFDPFHLGDTYTKNTLLWGRFNGDLPIAPVEPVEGSKMHSQYGGKSLATKNARSATPEGFAYGFFMANNAIDHPAMALANKFDRLDRGLIEQALEAGVAADAIEDAVSDFYYMDLDDDAANAAIRDLMNPAPEPQQMQAETEQEASAQPNRRKEPKTQPAPAPGILGALSQAKQDRAAELKARFAAKARGQASSGLDPEYITLGGELVALYIEAGTKRFGQMLRDFAETTGLTMKEAQAPMRAAYNYVRDDMDLRGDDVSDMDDAAAVMAEVRAAFKGEDAPKASNIENPDNAPAKPAAQTPATGRAIAATMIKADTAITARGREVSVDYAIVELANLIPSQRDDGRDNPAYPQELQPRDRSTNKSQEQVRKIASGLKPALLGESPQASNGAPIILPTGEVLSGNGRTLALRAAYANDGKQASAYRAFMDAQGYPEGRHRQPVLVRIVTDPMTMAEAATFAREANERDQADMSVPEQAMADAKNLSPAVLDLYRGGDVDSAANAGFAKAFGAAVLSPNDAGRMRDNDGRMTQDALRRINAALLAKAYGDAGIVSSVLESTDTNIKAIGGALTDVAPLWAQMRAEVERGTIAPDADRTADLVEAVKLVDRARRENRPLSDFLNQTDMFAGDSVSPGAVAFLGLLYRDVGPQPFRRALGRDKMADALSFYAGEALKTVPGVDLLGESADTQAILATAKGRINDGENQAQPNLFDGSANPDGSAASASSGRTGSGSQSGENDVRGQGGRGLDQEGLGRPGPATQPGKIQDFGEKIGGARKDIAETGIKRGAKALTEADDLPAWRRQYRVTQIAASMRPEEKGKWTIMDEKSGRPLRSGYSTALFDTKEQAETAVPLYVVATKHRVYAENDGTHAIYRRVTDRKRVLMQGGFPDRIAADRYMAENAVQLIETNTRIDDSIHPALEEAIRDGDARREGDASVTPADFSEVFGFRAVEFGNWNNAVERQHILNQAYDAFLDMAEILRIPPKAVSLNGELALAFGARGSGLSGARAHYERNYGVINLTKIQGAGALAHEWWHALDHYLGRQDGKASSAKITNNRGDTVWDAKDQTKDYASHGFLMRASKVRPEVRAAMEKIVKAVFQRKAEFTEDVSTRERIAERQVADLERAMKQFRDQLATEQQWGRKKSPATIEQLAEIDLQFDRIRRQDYGDKQLAPSKGMSSLMLSDPVMKIMEVFKAVRGRQGYGMRQGRMVGEIHDLQRAIDVKEQSDRVLADAKEQRVKEKTVRTEFYSEAWKLDQGRTGDYWNTNHEMTARAFEAFIYDRLQDMEARNDFLSYEKHNNLPQYLMFNVKPYPEGKERQDMNAAFEQLFDTFQTRETDQGIELFQQDMSKPDAIVSGDELGAWEDIRQLGKKAEAWYRSNLVGRDPVINRETGWEIQFDATGARKTGGRKGDVLYRLVPALPAILENGRVISSEPDSRGRKEIRAVHKLSARVMMGGQEYFVVAAIREKADGTYHYDLSMDRRASGFSTATVQEQRSRTSALEGDSADINLELADPSVNNSDGKSLSLAQARAINAAARTELALVGLLGKIGLRVEAGRLAGPTGSYSQGVVSILRKGSQGWRHTLDHEIVHALRDPARWGGTHGLFTADEWRAMVRAARADAGIRDRVEAAYPDLDAAGRAEEMVAELYADWAAGRREVDGGPLRQALDTIRSFFRAMASVLRGEGFRDAGRIMERIASGEVGGRGPDGPGGRPRDAQGRFTTAPDSPLFRAWFGDSKAVDANGAPLTLYHGTRSAFDAFEVAPKRARGTGDSDAAKGFFFSNRRDVAETYTADEGRMDKARRIAGREAPRVEEVNLSIQNPYEFDMRGGDYDARAYGDIIEAAKEAGHDGVVIRNVKDDGYSDTDATGDVWVAFRPTQIKAVNNGGNWNPNDPRIREQRDLGAIREALTAKSRKAGVAFGFEGWRKGSDFWSDMLTDTMSKSNKWNTLSLVPGRPLFKELGRNLMAAQAYTKHKDEMDAQRGEWHSRAAETADAWMKLRRKDSAANAAFMDLLHDATIAQVDPTKAFEARKVMANDPDAVAREAARRRSHVEMAQRFRALPPDFKDMWAKVRADYDAIGDAFEAAILKNMELAAEVAIRRAKRAHARRLEEIEDEGLAGAARDAAITEADAKLAKIESTAKVNGASRLTQLRKVFESNRLAGPYVPLARYGNFFVTVRDEKGAVTSFSMFETAGAQRAAVADAEKDAPGRVQHGVMTDKNALKQQVDPSFVADVEGILASTGATPDVMDAIWQRWLETLPDQSIRTSKIHRKGRKGYGKDALRAYGDHLFHGSHQLAKLEWGLRLEDDLDEATEEAKRQPDPNRAQAIVNEMKKRHDFTMNPEGSPLVAAASGMAFTLQLAASPAAALVNISQTTLVGVPMLAAQFPKATVPGILKHLTRASRDFTRARGFLETANVLTGDEKAAMVEAVRRGVIDKTQGHSLAELADHGVTHSPVRDQVTRALGFFFHHAERFNREVTFLTAYRLAKEAGMEHGDAVEAATDGTWASHFDVQNNARPRFMQNDLGKLLTVFKSFQVNMLWRMARDLHQTFNGATPELRREARLQFTGISLSMMAHAGIRGVWGYALITSLLALFLPGDDDDLDAWLQDALLFEGDSAPVTAWNFIMGAALNGAPGQITGTDLTNRIGMAELWFRAPYDGMRSSDIGWHYVKDLLGPSVGWAFGSIPQGLGEISEGEYWRGTERILPKAVRDPMKAMRYAWEGVETKDGDIILEDVSIQQMLVQASGFTPAQVSQRYRQAGLLRKGQREIETRRRSLHKAATDAMRAGKGIPEKVIDQIRAFNREVPEWPVTSETIRSSYRGREAAAGRAQIGVNVNPRLTNRLNEALPQAVPTL
ncbi:PLxRFG domain-containing protein [uncultured Paracoccus sp.]|uniref:PLxRFG domain-containing protein n=1 Tax=uncultured Paracoccus sp. TaxID=189685 RepID=UPI0030DDCD8F